MKVRHISEFQTRIHFPNFDNNFNKHLVAFKKTSLGQIHDAIPWENLVVQFDIKVHNKGPECIFTPKGKLALMFLKNYAGVSDFKLIEQLNGNIHYQIFCDLLLEPGERFTDVKLLFDCVLWTYEQIKKTCKENHIRQPRTKIKKWIARAISFSKMKKKRRSKRKSLTRGLLRLLTKLQGIIEEQEGVYGPRTLNKRYLQRRSTTKKILEQQEAKFYEGIRPKAAIVSIDKPHIRPIVRGKEVKPVEFGSKLHKLQIDGISFIEHISFDAFHEGNRLKKTIWKAQKLTNKKVKILGADAIYATNQNRSYVTKRDIKTDFKPKGRPGRHKEHKSQLARMITKERASRLEGSFGTDKEYFLLNKIKARTKETEILWIFFGIHTSNALNIGRRKSKVASIAA